MRAFNYLLVVSAMFGALGGEVAGASDDGARKIVDQWIETQKAESELVFIRMRRWADENAKPKELRFIVARRQRGADASDTLLRILRPEDVQGVSVLVNQDSPTKIKRYLYLPAVGKANELTGAAKYKPFLGSDFSYADLEREVPSINSYERLGEARIGAVFCDKIRASEGDKAKDSPYAYRDLYIDKKTHRLQQVDFYGSKDKLLKVLTAYEYDSDEMDGSTKRPRRMQMKDLASGSTTEFLVLEGRIDEKLDPSVFTPARQETWKQWEVEEFIFQFGMVITG